MSPEKNRHFKVMWLEPAKDYGKLSFVRRHRIIGSDGTGAGGSEAAARPAVSVGQEVLVTWGRGKNSAYRARIEGIPTGKDRVRTKSDRYPNQVRGYSEGTASLSSSQYSEEDSTISDHGNSHEELESTIVKHYDNSSKIPVNVPEGTDKGHTAVEWAKPSAPAHKRIRTCPESLSPSLSPDGNDAAQEDTKTLRAQEKRRHTDLRLRVLKDAEHKLDHCIGMLRGLFHVVPELQQRLSNRRLPAKSSRRPCTDLEIDARQLDFERRAAVFYEIVQDITELRSDPDFTRWIAEAIRKFKD